ncbi:MAG: hypothetical protein EOO38_11450 [Cytophagaceae bacterium]|nr:MAG: hypothetical protein EOO38_11450 [Cytophagaceae bacterium]
MLILRQVFRELHLSEGRSYVAIAIMMTLAALAADVAPSGTPPNLLSATSKWQMDYAPSECRLVRSFGTGSNKITLQFGRMLVENYLEMTIAGPNLQSSKGVSAVSISTKAMANIPNIQVQSLERTDTGLDVIRLNSNGSIPIALNRDITAKVSTVMTIALSKDKRLDIGLGPMAGAMAALDKCMDDLMTTWGLTPAEQRARRSSPQPLNKPVDWFRPEDYPAFHGFFGGGALITIRLIVSATGSLSNCEVAKAGGSKDFKDLTCQIALKRARFLPAVGNDGQPIDSVWITRIRWMPMNA